MMNKASKVLALAALAAIAGCNTTDPGPFDPLRLQETMRNSAREVQSPEMRPLPTTLESAYIGNSTTRSTTRPIVESTTRPLEPGETIQRMSLQEIVQRTVANNLDIRVSAYEPAIEETRVVENEARFDPRIFANAQYAQNRNATGGTNTVDPSDPNDVLEINESDTETIAASAGIRQLWDWGTEFEVRYEASRNESDPQTTLTNPYYENDLVMEITQPLLRDFGREVNRARIVVARNNQRISMLEFRQQIEETLLDIEETYWQLVRAQRDVVIREELLQRTLMMADILVRRRTQDVTRVQISQANSSVENRRALLVRARARIRDLSDRLKRLMADPDIPVTSAILILPAVQPIEQAIHFDLDDQIDTAMENRAELAQQQIRIDSATIASRVAKNSLLPQLNFIGSVGVQGLDDSFGDAASEQADFDNTSYAVGFEFEIPLGNRAARSAYSRSLLQRQQAIFQYSNIINIVSEEVKSSFREIDTRWKEIIATRRARFAAEDALLALQQREDAMEPLTPDFVQRKLDAQATLADTQLAEIQSITDYNFSIARLERSKGTILRYNNVLMEEGRNGTVASAAVVYE